MEWVYLRQIFENNEAFPFQLVKPHVPQQTDGFQCGLYLIAYMEHAITGILQSQPLSDIWKDWSYVYPSNSNFGKRKRNQIIDLLNQHIGENNSIY
jgi:hypothetical protein